MGAVAACLAALPPLAHAETGTENADEAWLRYPVLDAQTAKEMPGVSTYSAKVSHNDALLDAARESSRRGQAVDVASVVEWAY